MTKPTETVEWLARQFRDNADTSPGEAHLASDAIEVEAMRDAFQAMLEALHDARLLLTDFWSDKGERPDSAQKTANEAGLAAINAAIAQAEREETGGALQKSPADRPMNDDDFDEFMNDATHAVNNLIPGNVLDTLTSSDRSELLYSINDALTPILRDLINPVGVDEQGDDQ